MPGATNFQKAWASIPGRIAQGALVDPALGTVQTGAHLISGFNPLVGHPEWGDPAATADSVVNVVDNKLDAARIAVGQHPGGEDYWRDLGGVISPYNFVAPEVEGAVLAEKAGIPGKVGYDAAKDAVNAAISAPSDTRDHPYWVDKTKEIAKGAVGGAMKPLLGAGAKAAMKSTEEDVTSRAAKAAADDTISSPASPPIGDSVPGRAGIDTPDVPGNAMSANPQAPGDLALASFDQVYGPTEETGSNMPPALFGGDFQSQNPDYPWAG